MHALGCGEFPHAPRPAGDFQPSSSARLNTSRPDPRYTRTAQGAFTIGVTPVTHPTAGCRSLFLFASEPAVVQQSSGHEPCLCTFCRVYCHPVEHAAHLAGTCHGSIPLSPFRWRRPQEVPETMACERQYCAVTYGGNRIRGFQFPCSCEAYQLRMGVNSRYTKTTAKIICSRRNNGNYRLRGIRAALHPTRNANSFS